MLIRERIESLIFQYGGVNAAAKATNVDAGYLVRLRDGEKQNPSFDTLKKLGLSKVVSFELLSNTDNKDLK